MMNLVNLWKSSRNEQGLGGQKNRQKEYLSMVNEGAQTRLRLLTKING